MSDPNEMTLALQPLPWQQGVWQSVIECHLRQRMPHALLLAGQRGVGKKILLQAVAARLLCQTVTTSQYACGHCKTCRWYQQGIHPDFLHIAAQQDVSIKIDEIRAITDFAMKTSQQGTYKIILIEESNRMTLAAANALLKILEEPGSQTLFLLSSDHLAQLPATIKSRCQLLRAPVPERLQALNWLSHKIPDLNQAQFLLDMASGAPLQALVLAEDLSQQKSTQLHQHLTHLVAASRDPVAVATEWLAEQDLSYIVTYLQLWTYACITQQLYPGSPGLQLPLPHGIVPITRLFNYWDQLLSARAALASNLNPLLLLESLLIRLASLQNR